MQLQRNKEMSPRNNRRPNDTLLRGLIYCGICKRKMHLNRYTCRGPEAIDYSRLGR